MKHTYDYNKNKHCSCGKLISNKSIHCISCATKLNSPKKWTLKLRLQVSGKKHWNWKNGITKLNRLVKKLILYKEWRSKVFERDNYICQICKTRGEYLEPHHKIPFSIILLLYNIKTIRNAIKCKLLWDISWGITLCRKCHADIHERNYRI